MNQLLVQTCQMFLVPGSVLFTALGVAKTEGLKSGVSLIGTVISLAWFIRVYTWPPGLLLPPEDKYTALALAGIFLAASAVSLWIHGNNWKDEQKKRRRRRS